MGALEPTGTRASSRAGRGPGASPSHFVPPRQLALQPERVSELGNRHVDEETHRAVTDK